MARRTALLRLLFGLALVLQTLVGPPAAPLSADNAIAVNFTCGESTPGPCTVTTGGSIVVTGTNFPASLCPEFPVNISLINASLPAPISLGSASFTTPCHGASE